MLFLWMAKSNDIFFLFIIYHDYLEEFVHQWWELFMMSAFTFAITVQHLFAPYSIPFLLHFTSHFSRFTVISVSFASCSTGNHTNVENKLSPKTKLTRGIERARERGWGTAQQQYALGDIDCKMKIGGIQIWCIWRLCHSLSFSLRIPAQCLTFIQSTPSFLLQHPHPHPLFLRFSQCVFQFDCVWICRFAHHKTSSPLRTAKNRQRQILF